MPWLIQILWFGLLFVGLIVALWIGFWLLLALFVIGVAMVLWTHLRAYLLAKGILNPTPGVPPSDVIREAETTTTTTLIEGDFTRVETKDAEKID